MPRTHADAEGMAVHARALCHRPETGACDLYQQAGMHCLAHLYTSHKQHASLDYTDGLH